MKLLNAFSLNMIPAFPVALRAEEISLEQAKALAPTLESAVGHPDTAAVFGEQLGVEVPAVRSTVALTAGEQVLVGQYRGPRLPEGAKILPEGAAIQWIVVTVG